MTLTRWKRAVCIAGAIALLVRAPAVSLAGEEKDVEAQALTSLCTITEPEGGRMRKRMIDGNVETYTRFSKYDVFTCEWGDDAPVRGVYLKWYSLPESFILTELDADGAALADRTIETPLLNAYYEISADARGLALRSETEMELGEIAFYSEGELPEGVYDWGQPAEKADILILSAHADDEFLYFGGTIPTYAGERGLTVQIVYMACEERLRMDEAMEGLWLCGVRNAPVFAGFKDTYTETLEAAEKRWGREETLSAIVGFIRRFEPEVIVSHDLEGEYGHGAHRITAHCTLEAVSVAADGTQYLDSAEQYGAWQTKKLYLHLFKSGAITMDWRVPLDAFDGQTALEMANLAYQCHASQQDYHKNVYDTGDYSSAEFGLAYTMAGVDMIGGDFMENIDPAVLSNYIAPTPSPSPTAAPTIEPTPSPTAAPSPAPAAEEETGAPAAADGSLWLMGAVLMLLALCIAALTLQLRKKRRRFPPKGR
jgi:LmbE family N-acetylglucosaminyl deacetylase